MEFPVPLERIASHISQRPPSPEPSTIPNSPQSSFSHHDDYEDTEKALPHHISQVSRPPISRDITKVTTRGSTLTQDPNYEIDFLEGDPEDPRNWPLWYKAFVLFCISFGTLVIVLYSTSYTAAIGAMQKEFHVNSEAVTTLGVTTYLLGLAVGSLILAPISETYGRKPVYAISMFFFVILVIPCATATSMSEIIIVRFFGAIAGSAMIANAPGTIGDLFGDDHRAAAFSIWSIGPMNGPTLGPIIGGFVTEYKGWRWANWVVMIAGGAAWGLMVSIKETYAPALLQGKAKKLRKQHDDERYWSQYDVKLPFFELMKVNLSRPFVMAITEPICIFWNLYIAIIYGELVPFLRLRASNLLSSAGILYLCFVAYPIVFTEARGWSIGISGLAFTGIGIGCMLTIVCAPLIRRMINAHKPDETGQVPPEAAMSAVCIAAILTPIGELWFAWTCLPKSIHWAISIAAGIPFGAGNAAVFIYAGNYLVQSYGIYAASAMAGNAVIRSFLGGTLPLAGPPMYRALGANWAGTVLGLLEVIIIPIPFIFYKMGGKIRQKSALIREMREIEERQERKKLRAREKLQRDADRQRAAMESSDSNTSTLQGKELEYEAEKVMDRVEGLEVNRDDAR